MISNKSSKETPRVSAIINCLNGEKYVTEAIKSILDQTLGDIELIFWDNASTDRTAEIVKGFNNKIIRYFRGDKTVPLGEARNLAIQQARGQYIGFLDYDDLWHPRMLEELTKLFDNKPKTGFVMCDCNFIDNNGVVFRRMSDDRTFLRGNRFIEILCNPFLSSWISFLYKREAIMSLEGPFNPNLHDSEDTDIWLRLAEKYEIDFTNEILATVRWHGENRQITERKRCIEESLMILNDWEKSKPEIIQKNSKAFQRRKMGLFIKKALYETKHRQLTAAFRSIHNALLCINYNPFQFAKAFYNMGIRRILFRKIKTLFYQKKQAI